MRKLVMFLHHKLMYSSKHLPSDAVEHCHPHHYVRAYRSRGVWGTPLIHNRMEKASSPSASVSFPAVGCSQNISICKNVYVLCMTKLRHEDLQYLWSTLYTVYPSASRYKDNAALFDVRTWSWIYWRGYVSIIDSSIR